MANKNFVDVSRVLPLMVANGEEKTVLAVAWSLPGNVHEYDEPELTVLEASATALNEEICVHVAIEQITYYTVEEAGLVEKVATTHQITKMVPVEIGRAHV